MREESFPAQFMHKKYAAVKAAHDETAMSYNLTSLTDGIWNDVETFDTLKNLLARLG